ncbi:DNA repair and recombination protein RAD26 [Amniculicola lignicola CBS 123094]|uniref:DNA repair and recombination protein RAD26 n=1 Tax=Amniculicola lignicola CBS 123094 TaxID=1392246 RepID=A0A6A5W426_9PLEO|nr:DNA repair and recombination protein RAD26 [Amniculicola lignicola CBS 123094]
MIRKPFRPPSFVHPDSTRRDEPPPKRRRTSTDTPAGRDRRPLSPVPNPSPAPAPPPDQNGQYYTVLWRKYTTKKNKTWDGDGVLSIVGGVAVLADSETGKEMGRGACARPLLPGSTLSLGGKEVEIDGPMSKEAFLSGRLLLGTTVPPGADAERPQLAATRASKAASNSASNYRALATRKLPKDKPLKRRADEQQGDDTGHVPLLPAKPLAARTHFKTPLMSTTVVPKTKSLRPQPRHDPAQPNALVMKRPSTCPKGRQIVDVVVDPILGKHLRDHQREGVAFLYECVMGMRCEGEGAIMADEMGLGKTLQTIALLWTLMKQTPIYEAAPVVTKALVVCPAGLVNNWRREFRKWLGNERIGVFVAEGKNKNIRNFTKGKAYNVMIIGYEMLRTVQEELKKCGRIDIVIADEGHRLKTANNKAMLAIQSLNTERRVILSGTPLQNDLSEFYTAIDFVNPGLLGKRSAFKREFETPIVRSRQPNASDSELEKGEARWKELVSLTSQFIIRRTADVLAKYLPPKTEHIVFCKPTAAQAAAYRGILSSPVFAVALGNSDMALQLINVLKKVCNSPSLLKSSKDPDETPSEMLQNLLPLIPPHVLASHASSTKLRLLDSLLHRIYTSTNEKVVIVSNYTTTLDMIERLLTSLSYTFLRLDGSTPANKRQGLVERFNTVDPKTAFAFLLSAKSGGVGLNLIGASRIILFDIDWNPATDLQAMARIHRDGQKLPCKIYRFLVQGGLDEKIFQRQVMKMGLANAVVDNKASTSNFSKEELRDLFRLDEREGCQTHDLLGCDCGGRGVGEEVEETNVAEGSSEDEEEDEAVGWPGLKTASQVDMDEQEQKLKRRQNKGKLNEPPKLGMLMEYSHIDVNLLRSTKVETAQQKVDEEEMALKIDDDVLLEVLKEQSCRVGFLLTKCSTVPTDQEAVVEMEEERITA